MAYILDHEDIVVLSKQGDFKYILNDVVYLLWIEIEDNSHYVYKKILDIFHM